MTDNDAAAMEMSIKDFVYSKIEDVNLKYKENPACVSIKGSTPDPEALTEFWLKVLQNYYSTKNYDYEYQNEEPRKTILRVEGVTISVYMGNGTLMIQGDSTASEWFRNNFQNIMDAYNAATREPQSTINSQYTENYQEQAGTTAREEAAEDTGAGDAAPTGQLQPLDGQVDKITQQMKRTSLDIWSPEIVLRKLEKLRFACIKNGKKSIYPLWKSLLHYWFSNRSYKVYIVTPFLDAKRLKDVCQIILNNQTTANLDCFYVRSKCNEKENQRISEVKDAAKERFDPMEKKFLEDKVYCKIKCDVRTFHAKFIAAVKEDEAEVLLTSANFSSSHFGFENMESVLFQRMPKEIFIQNCLSPINPQY